MRCLACQQEIKSYEDTVDDGQGLGVRLHKACVNDVTEAQLDEPAYQESTATVRMPEIPSYVRRFTGTAPAQKAASEPQPVSPTQCLICKRGIQPGTEDVVTRQGVTAHVRCLLELGKLLHPERQEPTKQTTTAVKAGGEYTEDGRLAKRNAVFLVNALADLLRTQEAV